MIQNYYYFLTLKTLILINNNKWRKFSLMLLHTRNMLLVKEFNSRFFLYLLNYFQFSFLQKKLLFYFLFHLKSHLYYKFDFLIYIYFILFFIIYIFSLSYYFYFKKLFYNIFYLMKTQLYSIQISCFPYKNLFFFDIDLNLIFLHTIKRLKRDIFLICKKSYGHSTSWFIRQTNYIILKWFYKWKYIFLLYNVKKFNVNKLFFSLDHWIFNKQFHYINRNHSNKSLLWKIKTYFGPFNPYQRDFWVFGDNFSSIYLIKVLWINNY